MLYKITITKTVDNPDYNEEDYKKYRESLQVGGRDFGYSNRNNVEYLPDTMRKITEVVALQCDLDEKTFQAIRKNIIETL